MSVFLDQLVYTSFSKVGFKTLASANVPKQIQQTFIQQVVYQHWDSYKSYCPGYQAAYIHQVALEHTLFGWVYNDGLDDLGRSNVPYFVCYYYPDLLHSVQLENIFTCLHKGPVALMDRHCFSANLETIIAPDLWSYQPARIGVAIPSDVREYSQIALMQKKLLNLFIPVDETEITTKLNQHLERLLSNLP